MQIKKLEINKRPALHNEVKVTTAGHITEVVSVSNPSHKAPIVRLDKDHYALTRELEEFGVEPWLVRAGAYPELVNEFTDRATLRSDNIAEVRKTIRRIRGVINANAFDISRLRWVTLTYAENMTDTKRLYVDFSNFIKRLRYELGHFEYIVICEPQGRGSWHMHLILIFEGQAPFIPNEVPSKPFHGVYDASKRWSENYAALISDSRCNAPLFKAWRNGWVVVKRFTNVDNLGAYVSAYLTDMELEDFNQLPQSVVDSATLGGAIGIVKEINGKSKRFVKGARLFLYPVGFRMFRTSRGVKRPDERYMSEFEAEALIDEDNLTGESTVQLEFDFLGDDNSYHTSVRTINRRYYNSLRSKSGNDSISDSG